MCDAWPSRRNLRGARRRARAALAAGALVLAATGDAWAHGDGAPGAAYDAIVWDLATVLVLALGVVGYALGLWRLRARGAASSPTRAACYLAGVGAIALAQLSPLDALSDVRFSAHMSQHELLVLFAAPLVVAGRPELVLRAGLPRRVRRAVTAAVHARWLAPLLRAAANRWLAVLVHAVVVWAWHVPALFEAALHSESVHAAQHLSFFGTSALFWWAMVRGRYGSLGYGLAVVFVFATALHKGLLGALIAFASRTHYPTHAARTAAAGGDPLRDQELAGMLMWVPAGVITAAFGVALFVAWLGAIERRASRRAS